MMGFYSKTLLTILNTVELPLRNVSIFVRLPTCANTSLMLMLKTPVGLSMGWEDEKQVKDLLLDTSTAQVKKILQFKIHKYIYVCIFVYVCSL